MNVQILMSKGAYLAFECLRAACIWLRSSRIWHSLIIRCSYRYYPGGAAALPRGGTSTFWLCHSFVIRHSVFDILVITSGSG